MRPALLVAEREPENALTVRKLLLETAKYNVITAHSASEAIETIHTFPAVAAAVITSNLGPEDDCASVGSAIGRTSPKIPIIYLTPSGLAECSWADHVLSTFEPGKLLNLVKELLGDPAQASGK
jgi:CheY-like chemotaxis protein